MRKNDLDFLLETAVARALGVKMPVGRQKRAVRRTATAKHATRRAA